MSFQAIPPDLIPYLLGQKHDYSTHQASIIRINIIILSVICVTTALRFWVRFHMLRSAGLDDIFMIIALVFAILLSTSCLIGHHFGLGKHIWNLTPTLTNIPSYVGQITKALYGCHLAYSAALTFTKFSILATYYRIFSTSSSLRKTVVITGISVLGMWVSSIFAIIFTCRPIQAAWDYSIKGSKCFPIVDFFYASAAFHIATDVLLCFLPLKTLMELSMPRPQRVVLCVLFSMGTFACIASIIRITQLRVLNGFDVSYQTVTSLNWSVIEVGTAITCASLSSLRPLASRMVPKLFPSLVHPSLVSNTHPRSWNKRSQLASTQQSGTNLEASPSSSVERRIRGKSMGEIVVEQTFDLEELREESKKQNDEDRNGRVLDELWTRPLFERSSEEELVEFPKPNARRK